MHWVQPITFPYNLYLYAQMVPFGMFFYILMVFMWQELYINVNCVISFMLLYLFIWWRSNWQSSYLTWCQYLKISNFIGYPKYSFLIFSKECFILFISTFYAAFSSNNILFQSLHDTRNV